MNADSRLVQVERGADGVAVVRLDNPKVNALSTATLEQLLAATLDLQVDLPGAVIVTGGSKVFAAGVDINELSGQDQARVIAGCCHAAFQSVAALPPFVIAAIAGHALGGGCELALACDYRIASENAVLGQPEILLGIMPGGGGTQRLTRVVGPSRAKELILTGRAVSSHEALAIGLVDEVVACDQLTARAHELALLVSSGARQAQALAKRAIDDGLDRPLLAGLAIEQELFVEVFATEDSRVGIDSFRRNGASHARFVGR